MFYLTAQAVYESLDFHKVNFIPMNPCSSDAIISLHLMSWIIFFANFLQTKKSRFFACNYVRKIVTWFSKTRYSISFWLHSNFVSDRWKKMLRFLPFLKHYQTTSNSLYLCICVCDRAWLCMNAYLHVCKST
jgi:hypothetical protein